VKIQHVMSKENSGLATSTMELVKYELLAGHEAFVRDTSGGLIHGQGSQYDITVAHHQLRADQYFDGKPKFLINHGEPLSSFGNGISMKATVEMATKCSAFICMRKDEVPLWKMIHPATFLVDKGLDLDVYRPLPGITERLSGEPAVLYYENIRQTRNPLYWIAAMQKVHAKWPNARLHIYGVSDKRMFETIQAMNTHSHLWPFLRSISGPVDGPEEVNKLLNKVDIVVSGLFPLYSRSLEAFGAGKGFLCPGYREHDYPFQCDLDPESMANALIKMWENRDLINFRSWAEKFHDVRKTVEQSIDIYRRFL